MRHMLTLAWFAVCFAVGYLFFLMFSHPEKKKQIVPHLAIRNVELLPNVKLHIGRETYWLHHWLVLSLLLGFEYMTHEISYLHVLNAALVGGIAQGLRYPDRFKIRFPRTTAKSSCV